LTEDPPVVVVVVVVVVGGVGVGTRSFCGCHVGVETPLDGFELGACCMSFPCSFIRAGASF
jgi:hypothetical protein